MRLETDRLLLAPIGEEHEEDIHRLHCDPVVVDVVFDGRIQSDEDTKKKVALYIGDWRKQGFGFFAVYMKSYNGEKGDFLGRSGLRYLEGTTDVELGHCFFSNLGGKGIAPEAGRGIIRFAFDQLGLKKIVGVIKPENERALRAAPKAGFRYIDDRWHYGHLMKYVEVSADDFRRVERVRQQLEDQVAS